MRTSWAIRERTRTVWTEIDLSKAEYGQLRPGRYVYTSILIECSHVYALPQQALMVSGNQTYCYLLKNGKTIKTPVEPGISDGTWVEIEQIRIYDSWVKVSGDERIIVGNLDELSDGETVQATADPQ